MNKKPGSENSSVCIIGAGVSGMAAARSLLDSGWNVRVFEKSRGPGGRSATRREGPLQFDHGAQYFTARDERVLRLVDEWTNDGVVAPWDARIGVVEEATVRPHVPKEKRYVGLPGMNVIARALGGTVEVSSLEEIARLERDDAGWWPVDRNGRKAGAYDAAIVSAPAPQAAVLLADASELAEKARAVAYAACWAVMVAFSESLATEYDAYFYRQGTLDWAARNASKPGRAPGETWVLHASSPWSGIHLDSEAEEVAERLLAAFFDSIRHEAVRPTHLRAHRWRYSKPETAVGTSCLWSPRLRIGACGDWCPEGARIEGAILSGWAVAERVTEAS